MHRSHRGLRFLRMTECIRCCCWVRLMLLCLTVMSFRLLALGMSCVRGCLRVSVFGSVHPPHPQSFMCTMAEASLRQHAESKHPKSTFELCFPSFGKA